MKLALDIEQSPSQNCGSSVADVSYVIVGITISRRSLVFSQSSVPTSLSDVGGLTTGALDLVNCSLSVA